MPQLPVCKKASALLNNILKNKLKEIVCLTKQIAKQFRELYFGGNWTSSNLRDNLAGQIVLIKKILLQTNKN